MNEELVRHELDTHNIRLNDHSKRLDNLEREGAELKTEIKNLCDNLKSLTSMMKWFITAVGGSFIGFFFYAVQQNIFK